MADRPRVQPKVCRHGHDLTLPENQYVRVRNKSDVDGGKEKIEIIDCAKCRSNGIRELNQARTIQKRIRR